MARISSESTPSTQSLELGAVDAEIHDDPTIDPGRPDVDVPGHDLTGQVLGLDLHANPAPPGIELDLGLAAGTGPRGRDLVLRRQLGLQLDLPVVDLDQLEDLAGGADRGEALLAHDVELALPVLTETGDEHPDRAAGRHQLGQPAVPVDVEETALGPGEAGGEITEHVACRAGRLIC